MSDVIVKMAQDLKRRGYTVTETVDKGLLVEKETFWGRFSYDTGIGIDRSRIKLGRTILLCFFYGAGILTALYWVFIQKKPMKEEVISVTAGR